MRLSGHLGSPSASRTNGSNCRYPAGGFPRSCHSPPAARTSRPCYRRRSARSQHLQRKRTLKAQREKKARIFRASFSYMLAQFPPPKAANESGSANPDSICVVRRLRFRQCRFAVLILGDMPVAHEGIKRRMRHSRPQHVGLAFCDLRGTPSCATSRQN